MDCQNNRFCRTLSPEARERLCSACFRRSYAKGQVVYRADLERWIVTVVSGAMVTPSDFDEGVLDERDRPAFMLETNGLLLGTDSLFVEGLNPHYEFIHYECLGDTTLAFFNRDVVRNLFETDVHFAKMLYQNLIVAAAEACEFAAMLRVPNVERSVKFLLEYASRKGFKVTQVQMAQITGHNRTSVARALKAIRAKYPTLWEEYESR